MKIIDELVTWLNTQPEVINKTVVLNKIESLKPIPPKICKHEWVSDLTEKELNSKHNIIYSDRDNKIPTTERWDYGNRLCKLCNKYGGGYFCPNNPPSHKCEYDENEICIRCGLPEERK